MLVVDPLPLSLRVADMTALRNARGQCDDDEALAALVRQFPIYGKDFSKTLLERLQAFEHLHAWAGRVREGKVKLEELHLCRCNSELRPPSSHTRPCLKRRAARKISSFTAGCLALSSCWSKGHAKLGFCGSPLLIDDVTCCEEKHRCDTKFLKDFAVGLACQMGCGGLQGDPRDRGVVA